MLLSDYTGSARKVVKVKFDERQALRQLQQYGYHGSRQYMFKIL